MKVKELIEELKKYDENKECGLLIGYYNSQGEYIETREEISLHEQFDMKRDESFVWIG